MSHALRNVVVGIIISAAVGCGGQNAPKPKTEAEQKDMIEKQKKGMQESYEKMKQMAPPGKQMPPPPGGEAAPGTSK